MLNESRLLFAHRHLLLSKQIFLVIRFTIKKCGRSLFKDRHLFVPLLYINNFFKGPVT